MLRRCSTTSSSGPVRRDASRRQTERRPATDVLLLEAGPRDRKLEIRIPAAFSKLYGSAVDWGYRTVPQENLDGREIYVPLGKTLGGSSSINAQMVTPRPRRRPGSVAGAGLGVAEAEQAYARSSSAFLREPLRDPLTHAFVAAARALGIPPSADLNAPDNSGVGLVPVSQRRGRAGASPTAISARRCGARSPWRPEPGPRGSSSTAVARRVAYRLDGREEEDPRGAT